MADLVSTSGKGLCAVILPCASWQTSVQVVQGGASSLAVFLETAPPPLYLVYMLAAGFGIPVSTGNLILRAALL